MKKMVPKLRGEMGVGYLHTQIVFIHSALVIKAKKKISQQLGVID